MLTRRRRRRRWRLLGGRRRIGRDVDLLRGRLADDFGCGGRIFDHRRLGHDVVGAGWLLSVWLVGDWLVGVCIFGVIIDHRIIGIVEV